MQDQTEHERALAMQVLEELCAAQRIKTNDKLKELFWQGVAHGWNRAGGNSRRRDREEHKPTKPVCGVQGTLGDSRVESSVGLSLSDVPTNPKKRGDDIAQGGVFKL